MKMGIAPEEKCALVVKPVAWSPNGYRGASGPKVVGGFVAEFGYGGEEWNNLPTRLWKGQRVFHTQSAEKLNGYADYGHLAILMIAMQNDTQYIVGLACAVRRNDNDDMAAISRKLKLDAVGESVWEVEAVKKSFKGRQVSCAIGEAAIRRCTGGVRPNSIDGLTNRYRSRSTR